MLKKLLSVMALKNERLAKLQEILGYILALEKLKEGKSPSDVDKINRQIYNLWDEGSKLF